MEPYRLTTNRAPLSETLGPPGFHPLLPGKCPEDCLTAHLAEHGYKDELPLFRIDDSNDTHWSLSKHLESSSFGPQQGPVAAAAAGYGGGGGGGRSATHPAVAAASSLQRSTLSMLAAAQRQRVEAEPAAVQAASGTVAVVSPPCSASPPPSPPPPPPSAPRQRAGSAPALYGNPAAALSQGAVQLPELRPASDVGRRLWLSALAGSAPLSYLAQTAPSMPDRRTCLGMMWQSSVPVPRATWFVRLLYTHLARQQLRPLPPPPPLPIGAAGAAAAAAGGSATAAATAAVSSFACGSAAAAAAAAAAGVQAASSALASTRAALWTADLLAVIDAQFAVFEATAAAAGSTAAATGGTAGGGTGPLPSPAVDHCTVASPGIDSPDGMGLSVDDALRIQDAAAAASGAAGGGDPRARLLDHQPGAAVLYFVRLAGATFLDGLLDTAKLVDWACGHLAAVSAAFAGVTMAPAASSGGAAGRPLTAAEQMRAQVGLQLLLACLSDLVQSQLHVRRVIEASLELLMAARSATAISAGGDGSDAAAGGCGAHGGVVLNAGAAGNAANAASPLGPGSPPLAYGAATACASPFAFGPAPTASTGGLGGGGAAATVSGGNGSLSPAVIQLALDCLEGCVRDAPAAVLSMDSLPLIVRALKAPWPSAAVAAASSLSCGGGARNDAGAAAATEAAACPRRRAMAERLAAAHAGLATSVNTRLLSFNPVTALRELDRAAAVGDLDAGLRTLSQACTGDLTRPGPAVYLLGNWTVGLAVIAPPALVPPSTASPAAATTAATADDMAARADLADMGLPCRTVYACRLLVRLAAEVRRCRTEAASAAAQGLSPPPTPLARTNSAGGGTAPAPAAGSAAPSAGPAQQGTLRLGQGLGAGVTAAQQLGASAPAAGAVAATPTATTRGSRGGSAANGANAVEVGASAPALQDAIVAWLLSRPGPWRISGTCGGGGNAAVPVAAVAGASLAAGPPSPAAGAPVTAATAAMVAGALPNSNSGGWDELHLRRTVQFLVSMAEAGVFSPTAFVQRLLVDGVFDAGTAGADWSDGQKAAVAAAPVAVPLCCYGNGGSTGAAGCSRSDVAALAFYLQQVHPQFVTSMDEQAAAAAVAASAVRPGVRRTLGAGVATLGQQQQRGAGSSGGGATCTTGTEQGGTYGPVSGNVYGRTRKSLLSMARHQGLLLRTSAAAAGAAGGAGDGDSRKRRRRRCLGPASGIGSGCGSGRDGPEAKRRRVAAAGTLAGRGVPHPPPPFAAGSPTGSPLTVPAAAVATSSPIAAATPVANGTSTAAATTALAAAPGAFERVLAAAVRSLESVTYMSLAASVRGRSAAHSGGSGRPPPRAPSPGAPASPGLAASPGMMASSPSPSSSPLWPDLGECDGGGGGAIAAAATTGPRVPVAPPLAPRARGGGRAAPGRGPAGEVDLLGEVRALRPWQQRLVAAAVCRHVNAVLTAALMPPVPFGAAAAPPPFPSSYVRACAAAALTKPAELPGGPLPEAVAAARAGGGFSPVKHGDTWLLRCLALLEACQVWLCAPQLLLHLAALHVEAAGQWATSTASSSGSPPGPSRGLNPAAAALEGGGLLWHRLRLQSGLVLASLESFAPRLMASGLLLPSLDVLTTWAIRYGAPPAAGRRHLGRAVQCAGVLAAAGGAVEAPGVRAWWERLQRLDSAHGQHWLIGDLTPYTQALASSASSPGASGGGSGAATTLAGGSSGINAGSPPAGIAAGGAGAAPPGLPQPRMPLIRLADQAVQVAAQVRVGSAPSQAGRWKACTDTCAPLAAALAALLIGGGGGGAATAVAAGMRGNPASMAPTAAAASPGSPGDGVAGGTEGGGGDSTERLRAAARQVGRAVAALCTTGIAGDGDADAILLLPVAGIVHAWIRCCCAAVAPAACRAPAAGTTRGSAAGSPAGSPAAGGATAAARPPVGPRATASAWGVAGSGLMLCLEATRLELCNTLGGTVSEQRLQRALLATCCAALCDPAAAATDAAAAFPDVVPARSNSPPRPRPGHASAASGGGFAATAATAAAAAQEAVLRLVLCAVSYGQLLLADAVALLCQDPASTSGSGAGGGAARGAGAGLAWDVMACRRALLGPPPGLPGCFCRAEAFIRSRIQASMPLDLVWGCLSDVLPRAMILQAATPSSSPSPAADSDTAAIAAMVSYPPLRHCLLSDPRALHERLCSPAAVQAAAMLLASVADAGGGGGAGEAAVRLPQRLVVLSLAAGQLTPLAAVAAHEAASGLDLDALLAAALVSLEPYSFPLMWLLLRLLVDEQALILAVMGSRGGGGGGGESRRGLREAVEAAVAAPAPCDGRDGGGAAGRGGGGGGGPGGPGGSELRAADKAFCDAALVTLLAAPGRAELFAEIAWQLGRGVGEYLLKSTDWLLQDRKGEQLLGHTNLAQLVARLGRTAARPPPSATGLAAATAALGTASYGVSASTAGGGATSSVTGSADAGCLAAGRAATPAMDAGAAVGSPPFAVESAVADLALAGLYKAGTARQREFAGELIRQLVRMADAVRRAALAAPSAGPTAGSGGAAGIAIQGTGSGLLPPPPPLPLPLPPPPPLAPGRARSVGAASGFANSGSIGGGGRALSEDQDMLLGTSADGDAGGAGGDGGDGAGGGGRKRGGSFMGFGSGRTRRMGGGGGGLLARSDSRGDLTEALRIGSPAALQVALWVRVRVLMPLLPLIYMDRDTDPRKNLRSQLVPALLQLLASPLIWAAAPAAAAATAAAFHAAASTSVLGTAAVAAAAAAAAGDVEAVAAAAAAAGDGGAAAAAAAAAGAAGEALPERLLHILCALVSGQWPSWLKPPGQKKLKEVPQYDNVPQLITDLDQALAAAAGGGGAAAPLSWIRERITSVLPLPGIAPRQLLPLQSRAPPPPPAAGGGGAAAWLNDAGGGLSAASIPVLELDPAVLLPLESLSQSGDVFAQPYGSTPLPSVGPRRATVLVLSGGGGSGGGVVAGLSSEPLLAGAVRMRRPTAANTTAVAVVAAAATR